MSEKLQRVKILAGHAMTAKPWELQGVLVALLAAIIDWMEDIENGKA